MPESEIDDWTRFAVGRPRTRSNWGKCQPLTSVFHVTHIHHALNILSDNKISPQLIYDDSRLNTKRILVVWISPNDWTNGFRYGNVKFELDWSSLVAGKRFYWVGAMKYQPPACRILVTDQDRDGKLLRYDPTLGDGPWWHKTARDKHYWNGEYCLEFMFEGPIQLTSVKSLRFVRHHPNMCSIDYRSCPDRGLVAQRSAARFLAGACAGRLLRPLLWLKDDDTPTTSLVSAWNELHHLITRGIKVWRGSVTVGDGANEALARSV